MAHELQMALLPQQFPSIPPGALPTESAIKFSSFYYPMAAVSGDFFTVNRLSDTAVAVFIADVMGHGVSAGLVTTSNLRVSDGGERFYHAFYRRAL